MRQSLSDLGFHPYGSEVRLSMDLACQMLFREKIKSLRLITTDKSLALAAARRLTWLEGFIYVDNVEIKMELMKIPRIKVDVAPGDIAHYDAALLPFSLQADSLPLAAETLVIICENALSYKSLLHFGKIKMNSFALFRWLKNSHRITDHAGILGWRYFVAFAISMLAANFNSRLHFRAGQSAFSHVYNRNITAWSSYILVVAAKSKTNNDEL